jgi:hypothetical protein
VLAVHGKGGLIGGAFLAGFLAAGFIDHSGGWLAPSPDLSDPIPAAATELPPSDNLKFDVPRGRDTVDEQVEDWIDSRTVWR